ncbi:MAG: thiamine pyrophosphate-dependent enzyme, partial [bacterium]|nr:thiamine pyrophosphate-dependent enzyme [bacterium]
IWTLPAIYVCENNGYGELTAAHKTMAVERVSERAAGYGIPGVTVDGQDVLAVHEAVSEAVARARRGEGPSLVETMTYRFDNHAIGIRIENYRDPAEIEHWRTQRDPLVLFRDALGERGIDGDELDVIDKEVEAELAESLEFARSSPAPPPEAAFTHLFTDPIGS